MRRVWTLEPSPGLDCAEAIEERKLRISKNTLPSLDLRQISLALLFFGGGVVGGLLCFILLSIYDTENKE